MICEECDLKTMDEIRFLKGLIDKKSNHKLKEIDMDTDLFIMIHKRMDFLRNKLWASSLL